MANYFVSYDLNGRTPTHAEMDEHLKRIGNCVHRILETVWYVRTGATLEALYNYVNQKLSINERVLIIEASNAHWRNLLVSDQAIQNCWHT